MLQRIETPVLINVGGSLVAASASALLWRASGMLAPLALVPVALYAILVSVTAWVRIRMARTAAEEARDAEMERQEGTGSGLFSDAGLDLLPHNRAKTQFERFLIPGIAPLCALLLGYAVYRIYPWISLPMAAPRDPLLTGAVCAGLLFGAFLVSRFLLGLEKESQERFLRAPARAAGWFGAAAALTSAAGLGLHAGFAQADRWATGILLGAQGLVVIELLLNTIGSFYRSRHSRFPNLSYESRVAGLLTRPEGLLQDLAQALEYQFGWEISEHRLARGLVRVLLPLAAMQIVLMWLSTSLVFVDAGETALLERAGRPLPERTMEPGAHFKWPWPFETIRRFPTGRLLTTHIGYEDRPAVNMESGSPDIHEAYLWTVPHYANEDLFLSAAGMATGTVQATAVPVSLYTVNVPVEYRITNAWQYAYNHAAPRTLIDAEAYRVVTRVCMTHTLADFTGPARNATAEAVRRSLQTSLNARQAGVEITFVGLQSVHPPVAVAPAYELEIGALEERDTEILRAREEARQAIQSAHADAVVLLAEARSDRSHRVESARAAAERFSCQLDGWTISPAVFTARRYFDALELGLEDTRKIVVAADAERHVIQLDLEEPMDLSLFELQDIPGVAPGPETRP